jgi:hypothetical protein
MGMPLVLPLQAQCKDVSCRRQYSLAKGDYIDLRLYTKAPWLDWFESSCSVCRSSSRMYLWEYQSDPRVYHKLRFVIEASEIEVDWPSHAILTDFAELFGFWPPLEREDNPLLDFEIDILSALYNADTVEKLFRPLT